MADIVEYISGNIIGKFQVLDGKTKQKNVIAYVEGEDDIPFWDNVLSLYTKYSFTVITNRAYEVAGKFPNGKTALLNISNLKADRIICIDADLDLIVKKYSKYSTIIKRNPFIINTEFYAIENVLSQTPLLSNVVLEITGDSISYDFAKFLKIFSCAIADLFYLYLSTIKGKRKKFSLEDFKSYINSIKLNITNTEENLRLFKNDYQVRLNSELLIHQNSITQYRQRLKKQGFKERDIYKLMQGHSLYNSIIRELLCQLCCEILNKKYDLLAKSTPTPDYNQIKRQVYGFLDAYNGSLRICIDYNFNHNKLVKNYLPSGLKRRLDYLYL